MGSREEFLFKKADLILTVLVVITIASATYYSLRKSRSKQNRAECQGRLWGVGRGFQEFAQANGGKFPMSLSTNRNGSREYAASPERAFEHFNAIVPYLPGPDFLVCPQDTRVAVGGLNQDYGTLSKGWRLVGNSNLSYFVNLDAKPGADSILAGDRNLSTNSLILPIKRGEKLWWMPDAGLHGRTGNAAFSDGHVETLDFNNLNSKLPDVAGHRFSIP